MMIRRAVLCLAVPAALLVLLAVGHASAGSFAPAAGQPGSTAIAKDDPDIVAWATGATVVRGPVDIADPNGALAGHGSPSDALGQAEGTSTDVVSLGDGGTATLSFDRAITNGLGPDFAVFENGFSDTFLEIAFVEVSSDGTNFFRFDAVSETQTTTQVGGFGALDPTNLHNFAGKYRQGFGTPFDLDELDGVDDLLDVKAVTHVRIIDVVGRIDQITDGNDVLYSPRLDSEGNIINDLYSTPFTTGGFDLDGVGVINHVPEPASLALLGVGAACFVRRTRHRR